MRDWGWRFRLRARLPWLAALACLCGASLLAIPGHAGAEQSEEEKCQGELLLYEFLAYGVGTTLAPASGAEVAQHSTVTFTGESASTEPEPGKHEEIPLSFQVSSSKTRDSEAHEVPAPPYLASGVGTASPSSGSGTVPYSFTSSKATENAGTVYWQASFTRHLPHCNGGKGETRTFPTSILGAKPHVLTVLARSDNPAPAADTRPRQHERIEGHADRAEGEHHRRAAHPHRASGDRIPGGLHRPMHRQDLLPGVAAARAAQAAARTCARLRPALGLDQGATGGNERFNAHWRGRALKTLKSMLRGGHEVKLVVTAKVADSKHNSVQVQRVILLKG